MEFEPKDKRRIKRAGFAATAALAIVAIAPGVQSFLPRGAHAEEPTPTPTAIDLGSTPTPGGSEAPVLQEQAFHLNVGDSMAVMPGDVIVGDVAMSDSEGSEIKFLYDTDANKREGVDNTHTGMLVDVQAPGVVYATYGGDVMRNLANRDGWLPLKKAEMEQTGCVGGCADGVDIVKWTGFGTTLDQAHTDGTVVTPSETPSLPVNDALLQELLALDPATLTLDQKFELEQLKLLVEIQNCTCNTGECGVHPSPTPSATPEACPPMSDNFMEAGDTFKTEAGGQYIVQGDVKVDGQRYFDNSEKTFAVLKVFGEHTITAPYGADVQIFCPSDATFEEVYQKDLAEGRATDRSLDTNSTTIK